MRYTCSICGYVYDEEKEKIPWAELPADWKCPLCGASKSDFVPEGPAVPAAEAVPVPAGDLCGACRSEGGAAGGRHYL